MISTVFSILVNESTASAILVLQTRNVIRDVAKKEDATMVNVMDLGALSAGPTITATAGKFAAGTTTPFVASPQKSKYLVESKILRH